MPKTIHVSLHILKCICEEILQAGNAGCHELGIEICYQSMPFFKYYVCSPIATQPPPGLFQAMLLSVSRWWICMSFWSYKKWEDEKEIQMSHLLTEGSTAPIWHNVLELDTACTNIYALPVVVGMISPCLHYATCEFGAPCSNSRAYKCKVLQRTTTKRPQNL